MSRILIIDDEVYIRSIIEYNLKKEGHEVIMAEDAMDAEYLIEKGEKFDLIITDLMMPVMSGIDFIRKLRKKYKLYSQKILMISANGMDKYIDEANEHNVDGYILKPFNLEQLKTTVRDVLNSSKVIE